MKKKILMGSVFLIIPALLFYGIKKKATGVRETSNEII